MEKINKLYYDYVKKTGKYPKYLFIDLDTFEKIVGNFIFGMMEIYPDSLFMGMEVIEVNRKDFIWVG